MPATPIGVGDDDGAGMGLVENGVKDGLGRLVRVGIACDDVPLDGDQPDIVDRGERFRYRFMSRSNVNEPRKKSIGRNSDLTMKSTTRSLYISTWSLDSSSGERPLRRQSQL